VDAYFRAWLMAHRGPNSRPPNEDDSESCRLLLTDFFDAMNEWESDCEERRRQAQLDGRPEPTRAERHASVAAIFDRFCTEKWHGKDRPMWQTPPTYAHVTFFDEEQLTRNRILIITKEGQSGQDRYLYVLLRTSEGWRIDSRKWMGFGAWAVHSL
jgi:hypothetical protein